MAEDVAVRRTLSLVLALFGCGEPSALRSVPIPTAKLDVPSSASSEGLEHVSMSIGDTRTDAEVFIADLARVRLVALDARTAERTAARVTALREEHDAWLVVNGTFFSHSGEPMGLLRQGDAELNPLRTADWGVFEVDGRGNARLVHTRDYVPAAEVEMAVQCGPRVVIDGSVPSLKPQSAHRTALCIRGPSEVAVVITRGAVLADAFGAWLAHDLGCRDALLLDGGPSTQLSARVGALSMDVHGGWGVPNGIGIIPRESANQRARQTTDRPYPG